MASRLVTLPTVDGSRARTTFRKGIEALAATSGITPNEVIRKIHESASIEKNMTNPFTQKHLADSLSRWSGFCLELGIPEERHWTDKVVFENSATYLTIRVRFFNFILLIASSY